MNSRWIPERPVRRLPRKERPARLELTLELPSEHEEAVRPKPSEEDEPERGLAIIDFYL